MSDVRRSAERLAAYSLIALVIVVFLWLTLPLTWEYLSPFIIAVPFAAVLQPLAHFFEHRLRIRHSIAVILPVIGLFLLLAVALTWFVVFGFNQISYLLNHSGELITEASAMVRGSINLALERFNGLSAENVSLVRSVSESILSWVNSSITTWTSDAVNRTVNWAASIPYMLLYANFLVFGIFFIAKDFDKLMERYRRGMLGNPDTSTGKLTNSALVGFMGWIRCQAVYALLSLVAGSIYWSAFGYQYSILISIGAAILEFLPIVGNGTVYIPWAIIAFLVGKPASGIQALALYYGLLLIRRVTEPKLLSNSVGVSPLLSLMSMFAGLKMGGILGMIGSIMIAAVITTLWEGEFRRTIRYDSHVVFHYLSERWGGISAAHTQPSPPPAPKATGAAPSPQKKAPRTGKPRR